MGWLLDELKQMAGPDAEAQVRAAARRARQRVEPMMRELTGLRLKVSDTDWTGVTIECAAGLPLRLEHIDLEPSERAALLLGSHITDLRALARTTASVSRLLVRLQHVDQEWQSDSAKYLLSLQGAHLVSQDLLRRAGSKSLLERVIKIDEDVLGTYTNRDRPRNGDIKLYWVIIGATARELDVPIDALTMVVLTHELAHAYTHLGADIEANRWADHSFWPTDTAVVEGLAQYYTHWVTRRFRRNGESKPFIAYRRLLNLQSLPYRAHRLWLACGHTPEVVRAALLEFRRSPNHGRGEFLELLTIAAARLRLEIQDRKKHLRNVY